MRRMLATLLAIALALPAAAQDMRDFIDGTGRTVPIPEEPRRIVSLHDFQITLGLVELGAPVVGSHGRQREDGSIYLRTIDALFGVDFGNSDIAFIGSWDAMDLEAITALEPDLIIGRVPWDEETLAQYSAIAPTVLIDQNQPATDYYRDVADAAGRLDVFDAMLAEYEALLDHARGWIGAQSFTYAKIQAWEGELTVYAHYASLTRALDDLGFQMVGTGVDLREQGVAWGEEVSVELLPEQDADFLFDTYRIDQGPGDGPLLASARMEEMLPGYCAMLSACAEGRYVLVPREYAAAFSFETLERMVHFVVSHVAGRPGIAAPG